MTEEAKAPRAGYGSYSLPDPGRHLPGFLILLTDREPGTSYMIRALLIMVAGFNLKYY